MPNLKVSLLLNDFGKKFFGTEQFHFDVADGFVKLVRNFIITQFVKIP